MTDKEYTNVILEEMRSQFYALTEIVSSIRDELRTKASKEDVEDLRLSLETNQLVIKDTNTTVNDHERRITKLETS